MIPAINTVVTMILRSDIGLPLAWTAHEIFTTKRTMRVQLGNAVETVEVADETAQVLMLNAARVKLVQLRDGAADVASSLGLSRSPSPDRRRSCAARRVGPRRGGHRRVPCGVRVTLAAIATVLAIARLIAAAISWAGLSIAVLVGVRLAAKDRRCVKIQPKHRASVQCSIALRSCSIRLCLTRPNRNLILATIRRSRATSTSRRGLGSARCATKHPPCPVT